jgi:hypothetical protein
MLFIGAETLVETRHEIDALGKDSGRMAHELSELLKLTSSIAMSPLPDLFPRPNQYRQC